MATSNDYHYSTSTIGAGCTLKIHCKHEDGTTSIRLIPNNPEYNKLDQFYLHGNSAEIRDMGFALLALGTEIELSERNQTIPDAELVGWWRQALSRLTIPDTHLDDLPRAGLTIPDSHLDDVGD